MYNTISIKAATNTRISEELDDTSGFSSSEVLSVVGAANSIDIVELRIKTPDTLNFPTKERSVRGEEGGADRGNIFDTFTFLNIEVGEFVGLSGDTKDVVVAGEVDVDDDTIERISLCR